MQRTPAIAVAMERVCGSAWLRVTIQVVLITILHQLTFSDVLAPNDLRRRDAPLSRNGASRRPFKGRDAPGPLDLLMTVISSPTELGARKRAAVREASISLIDADKFAVAYYFLMSRPSAPAMALQLQEENATTEDLVFCDDSIADIDLSRKYWVEMNHERRLNRSAYTMVGDDDLMVRYDLLLPELQFMPRVGFVWGRQGLERDMKSAVLMSRDLAAAFASDPAGPTCGRNADFCVSRSVMPRADRIFNDERWHNDDRGDKNLCLCKEWTLESESLVIHHVTPFLLHTWASDKALFAELEYPIRSYRRCPAGSPPAMLC